MRRRTFPQAGLRNARAYYDWGQRPCPSPPLPEPVADRTSNAPHKGTPMTHAGKTLATVGIKQIFFLRKEYSTKGVVLGRGLVYSVPLYSFFAAWWPDYDFFSSYHCFSLLLLCNNNIFQIALIANPVYFAMKPGPSGEAQNRPASMLSTGAK